jgi:hypothetical protein
MTAPGSFGTKEEIQQYIKTNLPLEFGLQETMEATIYRQKFNAYLEFVIARVSPTLSAETVRYQSMLYYLTLLLLAVRFLRVTGFKMGETAIAVAPSVIVLYEILLGAIAVVFMLKAYPDYQRADIASLRNVQAAVDVQEFFSISIAKKMLEDYFWVSLFDVIGERYKSYDDALSVATGQQPNFTHTAMLSKTFDLEVYKKVPELKDRIDTLQAFVDELKSALDRDDQSFLYEVSLLQKQVPDPNKIIFPSLFAKTEDAYAKHLQKWIDARNELVSTSLDSVFEHALPEKKRLDAMLNLTRRFRIRLFYTTIEVLTPVIFFIASVLLIRFMH